MKRIVEQDVTVRGKIEKLYKGCPKPNGWFGGMLYTNDYGHLRVTGVCHEMISIGMKIELHGNIVENDYGEQLEASQVKVCVDDTATLRKYLSSASFQGIGSITAKKLVDAFGSNLFEAVKTQPQMVQARCGLNDKQLESLEKGLSFFSLENHLVSVYPHLGTTYIHDIVVNRRFGNMSIKMIDAALMKNPYCLLDYCEGISFSVVDSVALLDVKVPWNFEPRLELVFIKALEQTLSSCGYTYMNVSDFVQMEKFRYHFNKLAKVVVDPSFIAYWMNKLVQKHFVYLEMFLGELHLYSTKMHSFEDMIFQRVLTKTQKPSTVFQDSQWSRIRRRLQNECQGYTLTQEQLECIKHALTYNFSCIVGGPGRGKTFLLKMLTRAWSLLETGNVVFVGSTILLLGPTGKAVNRLKESCEFENIETVARFIYHNVGRADDEDLLDATSCGFRDNATTLIIVDESSMLSYADAARLLEHFPTSHIVFVGDSHQLPPVEPGPFFYSLLQSNLVPCFELTENHRSKSKEIGINADMVLQGKMPTIFTDHFQLLPCLDKDIVDYTINLYQNYLKNGCELSDILLLSPINKGVGSVRDMNEKLQNLVNRLYQGNVKSQVDSLGVYIDQKGYEIPNFMYNSEDGYRKVRIFDRVINTKNHVNTKWKKYLHNDMTKMVTQSGEGCFNGDMGTVIRYYQESYDTAAQVAILLDDGRVIFVEETSFKEWSLAYCITIHKSQGSECSKCLLLLPDHLCQNQWFLSTNFLNRNLLYTGITRAKDDVALIGSVNVLKYCINHEYQYCNTNLHVKLQQVGIQRQLQAIGGGDQDGRKSSV